MTEDKPHVVYPKGMTSPGEVFLCITYSQAFEVWRKMHSWERPWLIATVALGRVIDPSEPIIDVNE